MSKVSHSSDSKSQSNHDWDENEPIVVDDLPRQIPVTQDELAVIEAFLGKLLDELLESSDNTGKRQSGLID